MALSRSPNRHPTPFAKPAEPDPYRSGTPPSCGDGTHRLDMHSNAPFGLGSSENLPDLEEHVAVALLIVSDRGLRQVAGNPRRRQKGADPNFIRTYHH